jgi:succinate dehydrogenase/fumarate reductase-like Fe-S protein
MTRVRPVLRATSHPGAGRVCARSKENPKLPLDARTTMRSSQRVNTSVLCPARCASARKSLSFLGSSRSTQRRRFRSVFRSATTSASDQMKFGVHSCTAAASASSTVCCPSHAPWSTKIGRVPNIFVSGRSLYPDDALSSQMGGEPVRISDISHRGGLPAVASLSAPGMRIVGVSDSASQL